MSQFLQMAKSSGIIGVTQLTFILLFFVFGLFWVFYVRREKSLSSILLVPLLLAPVAIGWAGKFWTFGQATGNLLTVAPEHKQTLMASAISKAITLQMIPVLLIPFILLLLFVAAVMGLRFSSRRWVNALPQIGVAGLCAFIMVINMALNFYPEQTFVLLSIGLLGGLGALSQTSSKDDVGTSELAFISSVMVCLGVYAAITGLISWNYVITFEAVGYAAADHKEEMLEAGFQYVQKERIFMLAIAVLSVFPAIFNALKLSKIRKGAALVSLLALTFFTLGTLLHQDVESFIRELSGTLF
jgi:hypothetical protein